MSSAAELADAPVHRFSDWPAADVPPIAAGVYAIFRGDQLVYVGMAGRALTADQIARLREAGDRSKGLRDRLAAHASGRRSGDRFCEYVCDRFVLPSLSREDIEAVGRGQLSLDAEVRAFVVSELSYRFVTTADGAAARALEASLRRGEWLHGRPLLNAV